MDESPNGHPSGRCFTGFYAVVSYIPDPLGGFLDQLRRELVSHCRLRSHVTVLPPRELHASTETLSAELSRRLRDVQPFDVTLDDVEIFETSRVIYLSLRTGTRQVEELHKALNTDVFHYVEPFPFHPHLTLAQEIPPGAVSKVLDEARRRWRECPFSPTFSVQDLTFVQNVNPTRWDARSEHRLQPANLLRTA